MNPQQSAPPLRSCKACGSLYCGPLRCRFDDMEAMNRVENWLPRKVELICERWREIFGTNTPKGA